MGCMYTDYDPHGTGKAPMSTIVLSDLMKQQFALWVEEMLCLTAEEVNSPEDSKAYAAVLKVLTKL